MTNTALRAGNSNSRTITFKSGESRLASQYHNYFGLKCGTRWTGRSVNMRTQEEYREGTLTSIRDNFWVFDSMEEGVKGYFEFIQLERYRNLQGIRNPQEYWKPSVLMGMPLLFPMWKTV